MVLSLANLLDGTRAADTTIAIRGSERLTLRRFRADVAHNAERLRRSGYRCGVLICADSYLFAVGFLSLLHAGLRMVVPTNAQPATLAMLDEDGAVFVTDIALDGQVRFHLEPGPMDAVPLCPIDTAQESIAFFTSGSTGEPKRIPRSVDLLDAEAEIIDRVLDSGIRPGFSVSTVPHQHAYGMTFKVLWPLSAGIPFSAINHETWESLWSELQAGVLLVTSPSQLSRLDGVPLLPDDKRPSRVLSAGAPLPSSAARAAADFFGFAVTEMFGSTETGAFATRPADGRDAPWHAFAGVDIDYSAEGCLKVRSPAVSPQLLQDGWFLSADLAEETPDGGFRVHGRFDRIVKLEGKRISLTAIERLLTARPDILAAAVTQIGNRYQRLGAVVVLTADARAELSRSGNFAMGQRLRRELQAQLEPAALPRQWRFVDALPLGPLGKQSDAALRRLFESDGSP